MELCDGNGSFNPSKVIRRAISTYAFKYIKRILFFVQQGQQETSANPSFSLSWKKNGTDYSIVLFVCPSICEFHVLVSLTNVCFFCISVSVCLLSR